MRLRRTAAGGIAVLLGLASCSSGGGEARSTLPASTTTSGLATTTTASAVATTTTVVATTTTEVVPPTTSVVTDATAADPKVLAQQLQAVLDRYVGLYRAVADAIRICRSPTSSSSMTCARWRRDDFLGLFLIPKWQQYRDEGTAFETGPAGPAPTSSSTGRPSRTRPSRRAAYLRLRRRQSRIGSPTAAVVDDATYVDRGSVEFVLSDVAHGYVNSLRIESSRDSRCRLDKSMRARRPCMMRP